MKRLVTTTKNALRQIRHSRVRMRVKGTNDMPRLSVFRGVRSTVAQLIDDSTGKTLCFAKSAEVKGVKAEGKTTKVAEAFAVGKALAEKAKSMGVTKAVFDRGGYKYHGRVAAVADGAREGGLAF